MDFADAYLQKAGLRGMLVQTDPHPDLDIIVTIPAYDESGLTGCLDSLFLCGSSGTLAEKADPGQPDHSTAAYRSGRFQPLRAEVLILINAPDNAPEAVLEQNRKTLAETHKWIADHPHPEIDFHVWLDHSLDRKEAGVGLARKILMDEAVRRYGAIEKPDGIIASLDADVVVDPNYLHELKAHFAATGSDGCSIYFEHPVSPATDAAFDPGSFSPEVYWAIVQYELHLRYYVSSVRSTGYPYATHTVGSSFAVCAEVYCKEGGMNRRQGGEDFYFIQKVAQRGNFSQCNSTKVIPSPRPSSRVPFGTGPAVQSFLKERTPLTTYHPRPFRMLEELFAALERLALDRDSGSVIGDQPGVLKDFLLTQRFADAILEMQHNSASLRAFCKRFWRWFNMFRIMKFLHYARENGYPDMDVGDAARQFLSMNMPDLSYQKKIPTDLTELLQIYRQMDKGLS